MDLKFQIGKAQFNLKENPTILVCGETGCGKSYLLKKIWKQISTQYYNKVKFVFIDLKQVEYTNIIEANKIFPICLEVDKVDGIIDGLLNKDYDLPIVIFWDVFEDYLYLHGRALDKFKRLILEGPKKQIYTITCSSIVAMDREYTDLFSTIFLGGWYEENVNAFLSDRIKEIVKNSKIDYETLKTGEFIFINKDKPQLVRMNS